MISFQWFLKEVRYQWVMTGEKAEPLTAILCAFL